MSDTKGFSELSEEEERIGACIVDAAFQVHKALGPGLLEKIYEICLLTELSKHGLEIKRQVAVPIYYKGTCMEQGLRLDILVNDLVIIELKARSEFLPIWEAQILSQLKLSKLKLGYVINFHVPLIKHGIRRYRE